MASDEKNKTSEKNEKDKNWTVMLFMIAERLFEWADLSTQARRTLAEIAGVPQEQWLRIRVQLHTSAGVERYERDDRESGGWKLLTDVYEKDLTKGKALSAFISWALKSAKHADGDNSMLVMWGHAYPFGIGFRDTGAGADALDFAELSTVLERIQNEVTEHGLKYEDMKLEILGFDACDLATIELAQHFAPYAKYLVASQIPIPLPGWPYKKILEQLIASRANADVRPAMDPSQFGSYIVRTFCGNYLGEDNAVSLSLLSLGQAKLIFDSAQKLAEELLLALDRDTAETDRVDWIFQLSQTYRDKPFVDAADLCENLVRFCNDSSVRHAAGNLGNLLTRPLHTVGKDGRKPKRKDPFAVSEEDDGSPFILECGRNAHDAVNLHGASLYAPNVAIDSHDWRRASYWYAQFNGDCKSWCSLVEALSQRSS